MKYLISCLCALGACFLLQFGCLKLVGGKTTKSESNFFSSVARVQTGIRDSPKVMLLGSSMTGRFPDRLQGYEGVANLGCDGGSAVDTLRAIDRGILPIAPVLVVEGNTLYRAVAEESSEVAEAINSVWFEMGCKVPFLGATARPSAFVYSILLSKKIGGFGSKDGEPLPVDSVAGVVEMDERVLSAPEEDLLAELDQIFARLRERGSKVLLVILPPGAEKDTSLITLPECLSERSNTPLLDLTKGLPDGAVTFTDGVHMAPASAAAALRKILTEVEGH